METKVAPILLKTIQPQSTQLKPLPPLVAEKTPLSQLSKLSDYEHFKPYIRELTTRNNNPMSSDNYQHIVLIVQWIGVWRKQLQRCCSKKGTPTPDKERVVVENWSRETLTIYVDALERKRKAPTGKTTNEMMNLVLNQLVEREMSHNQVNPSRTLSNYSFRRVNNHKTLSNHIGLWIEWQITMLELWRSVSIFFHPTVTTSTIKDHFIEIVATLIELYEPHLDDNIVSLKWFKNSKSLLTDTAFTKSSIQQTSQELQSISRGKYYDARFFIEAKPFYQAMCFVYILAGTEMTGQKRSHEVAELFCVDFIGQNGVALIFEDMFVCNMDFMASIVDQSNEIVGFKDHRRSKNN